MKPIKSIFVGTLLLGSAYASASMFYVVDDNRNVLQSFDTTTLTFTDIGSLGQSTGDFGDLSWGTDGQLYWLGGRGNANLFTLNTTTGAATLKGNHGVTDLFGLGLNESTGVMYASQFSGGNSTYSMNTSTGTATLLSNGPGIGSMSYVPGVGLVGVVDGPGDMYLVNSDGTTTFLTNPGLSNDDSDFAYDPTTNMCWMFDWSGNVFTMDVANNFSKTLVLTGQGAHDGVAYSSSSSVPEPTSLAVLGLATLGLLRRRRK